MTAREIHQASDANCYQRRSFLKFMGLSPLIISLLDRRYAFAAPVPGVGSLGIDVHCHVFNASDLPVRGFVQRVTLGDDEDQVILDESRPVARALGPWLSSLLIQILSSGAPTASAELAGLTSGRPRLLARRPKSLTDYGDDDIDRIARALDKVLEPSQEGALRRSRSLSTDATDEGRELFYQKLLKESQIQPRGRARVADRGTVSRNIARGLLSGDGPFSRYTQWANWLISPRQQLVEEIIKLYGGEGRVSLFTPALVDFSYWLDDEPSSDLESQLTVMDRIQRLDEVRAKAKVHCFAPFDPWRLVADRESGTADTTLDLVKAAIMDMGFLGVKLYPPMGFKPADNRGGAEYPYPKRAKDIPDFTNKLNKALDDLFAWASREGVAVMAHASISRGAAKDYAQRAHPNNWKPVLQKYPNLRLNLGHFGGLQEISAGGTSDDGLEVAIGEMIRAGHGTLYGDLSYYSQFLEGAATAERVEDIRNRLRTFIQTYDAAVERLMYGSDWIMLGQEAKHRDYLDAIAGLTESLVFSEPQRRNFFGLNAARFLGLNSGSQARARLDAYHQKYNLDPAWLAAFDAAL